MRKLPGSKIHYMGPRARSKKMRDAKKYVIRNYNPHGR